MTAPDDLPKLPGLTLLRQIGRGQTSRVFAGKLDGFTGQYAVKVPTPETLQDRAAAERFANEVRLSLHFQHPNLVRGVSGVAFGSQAYLAMPRYRMTLADALSKERPNQEALLSILAGVAAGLDYLHKRGAVHQDVKPQNVYLRSGEEGWQAALGDFGSAYLAGGTRSVAGSPFYMSPEIYHGEASSAASDLYSFGVMAYEALAGKRPFLGESYEKLMVAHLSQFAPPLASQCPELPPALSKCLDQCLAKQPAARPSAEDVRRALTESPPHGAPPAPEGVAPALGRRAAPPPEEPEAEPAKKGLLARLFGK